MRIIKIILILLVVLTLLVSAGLILFVKFFNINAYRPQIEETLSTTLNHPVNLGDMTLDFSLTRGVSANISNVVVSDETDSDNPTVLKAQLVSARIDILSWLMNKTVSLGQIKIEQPEITVIRQADGHFNLESFKSETQPKDQNSITSPVVALPAIFIDMLHLTDGVITYIDRSISPPTTIRVPQLNIEINNFNLVKPFDFSIKGAVFADQPNVSLSGLATLNLDSNQIKLDQVKFSTDTSQMNLSEATKQLSTLFKTEKIFPKKLNGQLSINCPEIVIAQSGVIFTPLTINLSDVEAQIFIPQINEDLLISQLNADIKNLAFNEMIDFKFSVAVSSDHPNLSTEGAIKLNPSNGQFEIKNTILHSAVTLKEISQFRNNLGISPETFLPETIGGMLDIKVNNLKGSHKGILAVNADGKFTQGHIVLRDSRSGIFLDIDQIDLGVNQFNIEKAFDFNVSAACMDTKPNLSVAGKMSFDSTSGTISLSKTHLRANLDAYEPASLRQSLLFLKDTPIPDSLSGVLKITLNKLQTAQDELSLEADMELKDSSIKMRDIQPGINFEADQINFTAQGVTLDPTKPFIFALSMAYLGEKPNIDIKGKTVFNQQAASIQFLNTTATINMNDLSLTQLLTQVPLLVNTPLPQTLQGNLSAMIQSFTVGSQGISDLDSDVHWNEGRLVLDQMDPDIHLDVNQIELVLDNLTLDNKPFSFAFEAASWSQQPNLKLSGIATWNSKTKSAQFVKSSFSTDLSLLNLDALRASSNQLKYVPMPSSLEGQLTVPIENVTVSSKGVSNINSVLQIRNGAFSFPNLPEPISKLQSRIQFTDSNILLENLDLHIGEGNLTASGNIADYLNKQIFSIQGETENLDLTKVIDQEKFPNKIEGMLGGTFSVSGEGFDPTLFSKNLSGKGDFQLTDGLLTNINILQMVLEKLSIVPNLRPALESRLPERYQATLKQKDTIIADAFLTTTVQNGKLVFNPIELTADGFLFNGKGQLTLDQHYSVDGMFIIPADLSSAMEKAVQEMRYLFDGSGQINFPLKISGIKDKVSFMPDISQIGNQIIRNTGKEAILRAMGIDSSAQTPESKQQTNPNNFNNSKETDTNPTTPPATDKSPEQMLIEGVFDSIFGK